MRLIPASQFHVDKQRAEADARDAVRSVRRAKRNPLLALPAAKKIMALPNESKAALSAVLFEMAVDCGVKADVAWSKSKSPMAAYHRASSGCVRHLAKLLVPRTIFSVRWTAPGAQGRLRINLEAMDVDRSSRREVRNPLLALPSATRLMQLAPALKAPLRELLRELSADCRAKAESAWLTFDSPMATHYRASGIYAGHLAKLLSPKAQALHPALHLEAA